MSTNESSHIAQVIEPQRTQDGVSYALPVEAVAVAKVEAVDLDLLITTTDGQQFILTQAGLLAMTHPDSVIRYAGGQTVLASEEIKHIGALRPMESNSFRLAGSFRLSSVDLDDDLVDKVNGTGFGLGQDWVDITSKLDQSTQKIEQILKSLEQSTQSVQASAGEDPPPATQSGAIRTAKLADPNPFASPAPGAPPQPENDNTSDNDALPKVRFTLLAAHKQGITHEDVALGETEVRQLLGKDTVELTMNASAQNLEFEAGKVNNQLLLESVPTTTTLLVNINDQQPGFKIPEGLTINGHAISPGTPLSLDVTGMTDNEVPLNLQWKEGAAAAESTFQMTVSYVGPNGMTTLKTITFTGNADNAYTLDANGELRQFITSEAADLVVKPNDWDNTITTGNGNDTILGSGGADTINGGAGTDTMDYSATHAAITLNVITGAGLGGQAAGDQLSNIERVVGSTSTTDTLDFSGANKAVEVNFVDGTTNMGLSFSGFENAIGSAHGDNYVVNSTQFVITEAADGAGIDTVNASVDYALGEHLENLTLTDNTAINGTGNELNNVISGNSANNRLDGGLGADILRGGLGNDTYVVDNAGDLVEENANEGTDTVEASINHALATNVENLTLTGTTAINGTGNALNNVIIGNSANNRLDGGLSADILRGGLGNDTYVVDNAGDVVEENANEGTDTVEASINHALATNVENLTLTGTTAINGTGNELNNVIIGNSANNRLDGGDGADTLIGGDGDDVIHGDDGDDLIVGGAGADTINGGAGDDTASYSGSNAAVTVNLANNTASGGHAQGDVLINIENLMGSGTHGDTLTGHAGVNRIDGGGGNDTLDGGGGSDTLLGGTGDDTYIINNTGVTITENAGEGTDTVISSLNGYTLGANLENLVLTGSATTGTGNALNNTLTANNLGNTLSGGEGNDTLIGGTGNDTLNGDDGDDSLDLRTHNINLAGDRADGGAGNDTIIINQSQNSGTATILDGGTGTDTLQVWGTSGAALNLSNLNAINFERLDLRSDAASTHVSLSSAGIIQLVNNTAGADVLTLRMGSNDTYSIATETGITVTQGQSVSFYMGAVTPDNLVAQVHFEYA